MFVYPKMYDVVVVGAGHAGVEAALAASRIGMQTLLLTMNLDSIAQMSCNPAIGGLGKGHLVKEIDALGGEMGVNTDATLIQFRMLNMKKGPSVWGPRAQCDKKAYQFRMKAVCEKEKNLDIQQGEILGLVLDGDTISGVTTKLGIQYQARTVIITTGTFLGALLHVGLKNVSGGRMGDSASGFSEELKKLGFEVERLKTGTPPRLNRNSIDFSRLAKQHGDDPPQPFSFMPEYINSEGSDIFTLNRFWDKMFHVEQIPCWITYTSEKTHNIIRANLDKSPMYCGAISGVGPRYCPSIEDKVVRFADKDRHQLFLEPEGLHTDEFYINGCSTSLPPDVQVDFIRSVEGLENAQIMRYAYAVEYDFCPPTQLYPSLETKRISGLFFAGQINGTSGYEEAAAQGIMAGINAAQKVKGAEPVVLKRDEAYIGVLIDDLITKGTEEPYRMFTSRAEHRLLLRQDNADVRLTEIGHRIGLADPQRYKCYLDKHQLVVNLKERFKKEKIGLEVIGNLLKRPGFSWESLPEEWQEVPKEIRDQVMMDIKYSGYIQRELRHIEKRSKFSEKRIPEGIDYDSILGLKNEAKQKLKKIRPLTFGQASRISGITPADISILMVISLRKKKSP